MPKLITSVILLITSVIKSVFNNLQANNERAKLVKKHITIGFFLAIYTLSAQAQESKFEAVLACHNSADAPGMAIRLEQSGSLAYSGAIGLANMTTLRELHVDDVFQIGSVTKTFTAAAILKLSEQKKLSLQDSLVKYIPDINPEYKYLSIERILSHTSGLPDYLGDPHVTALYDQYAPLDQVIKSISKQSVLSKPGMEYSYSNLGYVLLGKVIEASSGVSYEQFLSQTFFTPLKMNNTFVITKGTTTGEVKGYTSEPNKPDQYLSPEQSIQRKWNVDRSWIASAGAIASTLADMSLWQNALKSGQVISAHNFQLMTTQAALINKDRINYGYGVDVYPISGLNSFSHQGMVPGFFTWHVYFPTVDLTATAFANIDSKHPGPALLDMIALQLNLSPQPVKGEKAARTARSLIGRYQSADMKMLTISYENNVLYSHYEGEEKRKIIPRENNAYSYECTENYFQLRDNNGTNEIVPVSLYHGEQSPLIKL